MEKIITVYFEVHSLKHSYVPVNSKSAHPHWAYPGHLTGVLLRTVGNLIHNKALLDGHLTFVSKRWSALQAKGFPLSACASCPWVIAPTFTVLLELLRAFEKAR